MKKNAEPSRESGKFIIKHEKRVWFILLAFCLLISVSFSAFTVAKYVSQWEQRGLAEANGLFFSSDFLKPTGETASYNCYLDSYGDPFFELCNVEKGRVSTIPVEYSISCTNAQVRIGASGTFAETATGTFAPGALRSEKIYLNPTSPVDGQNLTVTASTSPYPQTLSATFVLKPPGKKGTYSIEEANQDKPWRKLSIKTRAEGTTVNITWNTSSHAPDNNNPLMATWQAGTPYTLNLLPYSTYDFIFFSKTTNPKGAVAWTQYEAGGTIDLN